MENWYEYGSNGLVCRDGETVCAVNTELADWESVSGAIAAAPETARELKEIKKRLEQLGGIGEVSVLGMIDAVFYAKERAEKAEARIEELKGTVKDLCDILNPYSHAIGEAGREKLQKAFSMIAP